MEKTSQIDVLGAPLLIDAAGVLVVQLPDGSEIRSSHPMVADFRRRLLWIALRELAARAELSAAMAKLSAAEAALAAAPEPK